MYEEQGAHGLDRGPVAGFPELGGHSNENSHEHYDSESYEHEDSHYDDSEETDLKDRDFVAVIT